jgi:ubiquinone biosynthesis protein COQ9
MRVNDVLYLNSENDPRNWKNISLAILPQAQQELSEFFHGSPDDALEGKDLVVIGTARLVGPNLTNPGVIRVHVRESGVVHIVAAKGAYPSSMPARASEVIVESASQMWLKQPRASLDAPAH